MGDTLPYTLDWRLILLSLWVAALAGWGAVDFLRSLFVVYGSARALWICIAGLAAGVGYWAAYFLMALAIRLPFPASFDLWKLIIAMLMAMALLGISFALVTDTTISWRKMIPLAPAPGLLLMAMQLLVLQSICGPVEVVLSGSATGYLLLASTALILTVLSPIKRYSKVILERMWVRVIVAALVGVCPLILTLITLSGTSFRSTGAHGSLALAADDHMLLGTLVAGGVTIITGLALLMSYTNQRAADTIISVLEGSSDAAFVLDRGWQAHYINTEGRRILGIDGRPNGGVNVLHLLPSSLRQPLSGLVALAMEGKYPPRTEICVEDGLQGFEAVVYPWFDSIAVYLRDVTKRRRAEAALRESEEYFRSVAETASDGIITVDGRGVIRYVNRAIEGIFGYTADELVGESMMKLTDQSEQEIWSAYPSGDAEALRTHGEVQLRGLHKSGRPIPVEISTGLSYRDGETLYTSIVRDITERKAFEEKLTYQAFHDSLTGLPNRAHLLEKLSEALARPPGESLLALLYMDLDRMKAVNDSLGHTFGDRVISAVADRLRMCAQGTAIVARIAGDEFAVLMDQLDRPETASAMAEQVIQALQEPFELDGKELVITASVGIALRQNDAVCAEELFRMADIATRRAKRDGKAQFAIYDEAMKADASDRLSMEAELRRALVRNEFTLHYQPVVSLNSGSVTNLEALIRWHHPERGLVPPGQFIALAEETGLIVPLGRWLFEEGCRQLKTWHESVPGAQGLRLNLNLSVRQLKHPRLVEEFSEILARVGLDPGMIILEITESIFVTEESALVKVLLRLKELGFQLALDDFGTGYSSLGYLKRFPVDIIKIDRSFVAGLGKNSEDGAVVGALIAFARALGIDVTGEGVESPLQLAELQRLGCNRVQGYLFGRPMPSQEVADVLAAHNCS